MEPADRIISRLAKIELTFFLIETSTDLARPS